MPSGRKSFSSVHPLPRTSHNVLIGLRQQNYALLLSEQESNPLGKGFPSEEAVTAIAVTEKAAAGSSIKGSLRRKQLSVEEKNQLWKLVMKKATVYRSQDGNLTANIHPNIQK